MSPTEKTKQFEIGIAFSATGIESFDPDLVLGEVRLANVDRVSGKQVFRGILDISRIPKNVDGNRLHVVMFPFNSGEKTGISIQVSKKHHFVA